MFKEGFKVQTSSPPRSARPVARRRHDLFAGQAAHGIQGPAFADGISPRLGGSRRASVKTPGAWILNLDPYFDIGA